LGVEEGSADQSPASLCCLASYRRRGEYEATMSPFGNYTNIV
jgi:hypothetical protein